MNILYYAKKNLTKIPYPIGRIASLVPYGMRPGLSKIYKQRSKEIEYLDNLGINEKKRFVFLRVKNISIYAFTKIPFYRDLYRSHDVNPEKFKSFDDLKYLPVIKKSDLLSYGLELRSSCRDNRLLVNTGGSSGQPLDFHIEPSSIPHEWAHMHQIWKKLKFKQSDLKIVFGGRANVRNIVEYDSARHQLNLDIYAGWPVVANRLLEIFNRYKPKYLHGYPSSIFDFVIWLDINRHPLLPMLRKNIEGLFLGSEYPSPVLRHQVERLLGCKSVSWYGHTERSVLAYEREKYGNYYPFLSYGFSEAIENGEGSRLIGTSYYNHASPLIRYDTGDLIDATLNDGLLESFRIQNGRNGEFILDKVGNKIFLTGLIFGRHHKLFEYARYIQISQKHSGQAEVLVVPRDNMTPKEASELFDFSNVLLNFNFKIIDEPKRTPAGKVPLLVKESK